MSRTTIDSISQNQGQIDDPNYFVPKNYKNSQKGNEPRIQSQKSSDEFANPFFQMEMKFDSLKNYVDSITTAVNQHAALINKLRNENGSKGFEKNLSEAIEKFAESLVVKDLDQSFMITAVNENIDPKNAENLLQNSIAKFCTKLEIIGNGFSKLSKIGQTLNGKVQDMELDLCKKVNGTDLKAKVKKAKTKLRTELIGKLENSNKKLEEKVKNIEKKYLERLSNLENKITTLEKGHTDGIINLNSEELLKKIDFNSTAKEIEERIIKEVINRVSDGVMKQVNGLIEQSSEANKVEINLKIEAIQGSTDKQLIEMKKAIEDANSSVSKKADLVKFEDLEKEIMKQVSKLYDDSNKELRQKVESISKSIASIENNSSKTKAESARPGASDSERLTQIEASTTKARGDINKLIEKIEELTRMSSEKFEMKDFEAQLRNKIDRAEFTKISEIVKGGEEKYTKLDKIMEDLQMKIDKVNQNFDRKAAKLKKEFDIDSLIKQFKSKADEGNVQRSFDNVDMKISEMNEALFVLKKEIESINRSSYMSKNNDNAFITIKSVLPKACLSCGGTSAPIHHQMGSLSGKKVEKISLREKEASADRPVTAASLKLKAFPGPVLNATVTQGFGITPYRLPPTKQDSFK